MTRWLMQALCAGATVKGVVLLGLLALSGTVHGVLAQQVGTCAPAEAEAYLDVNNVRARIFNDGALFWKGDPYVYEVPKGEGVQAVFSANLWVGGLVNGALRIASGLYGPFEFWPGPLDAAGHPPEDCKPYDRIFELRREDLEAYNETGTPPDNVVHWPWQWGAPILDGDGNEDNYNLDGGDRPALLGDQMLWWVMNDAGNVHALTQAPPLGLDVRATAFAVRTGNALDNVTFYRYHLRYHGQAPLREAYVGFYVDSDLGDFDDDYIGTDTTLHLGYTYNADNDDEGGYGESPPAIGFSILRGPQAPLDGLDNDRDGVIDEPGEHLGLTSFKGYSTICGIAGCFYERSRFYNELQGRWQDGAPVTVGGNGRDFSEIPTRFMFSGDPTTGAFWSERNSDDAGTAIDPGDRRFIMASGPFTMDAGDEEEIVLAAVWSRGADHLDAVRLLKRHVAAVRGLTDVLLTPELPVLPPEPPLATLGIILNHPNPFSEFTVIEYRLPVSAPVRLVVYDGLGREVARLVEGIHEPGSYEAIFEAGGLPAGVYFYRLEIGPASTVQAMILAR